MLIGVDASRVTRTERTGTENYSLHLLRAMLEQDSSDRFRLYLSQPLPRGLLGVLPPPESRVIRLPRLWTHAGLSREMLRDPPDVLFVPSHVLPVVTPPRSVVVVYDVGHRFFPRAHGVGEWLYVEWAIRRHVRIASEIVTISEASKRDLIRLYRADPVRVSVAYPAVDDSFRPATREAIERVRQRYELPPNYVLHVGTLKPRKNLPRLVRAFAQADVSSETVLALVGIPGFGSQALARAVRETGLGDRVRRLSFVDQEDLAALYSGAVCVALVSLYEGFGMPALEALACGAAVVASSHGSLPEITHGASLLVNPLDISAIADGLTRVVSDDRLAARMRAAGPPRAAGFTWKAAAEVTLDTIRRAAPVARRRLPRPPLRAPS